MSSLAITKSLVGTMEEIIPRLEIVLKEAGFGILTRIDFDQKIKEKLGKDISRTVILGACHPKLAYDAFCQTTDVALLIPCNIVLRATGKNSVILEAMRPTQMLQMLPTVKDDGSIALAESNLAKAILSL